MRKQLLISGSILLFLFIATAAVIFYAKGYRLGQGKLSFAGTGLLVATSTPNGAQVFINDHLTTATDNTINLAPGQYNVKIFKEGYFPWQKTITIDKEVVANIQAVLFPTAPQLDSITATGVQNPVIDPTFTRIAYTVASQSATKNGVYILDMSQRPILTLQAASTQITDETTDAFSQAKLSWSPNGDQLVATISARGSQTTYLLQANGFNQTPQDVTETLANVQNTWQQEAVRKHAELFANLKKPLANFLGTNASIISFSPDETKILYSASQSATLPTIINPPLPGTNDVPQQRNLNKGNVYVYDIKTDTNYILPVSLTCQTTDPMCHLPISWFADSAHIIYVTDGQIKIMETDGSNVTTVYAGPFIDNYVFPWSNGSKVVILTNLGNPTIPPNLYTLGLK